MQKESNKIFKNTLFLYVRSVLSLVIKLYTSRVILHNLGVEDYGVYNVVGGLVAMFSFLNGTMAASTQRFLSYEIGLGTKGKLNHVFSAIVNIHLVLSVVVLLLVESVGMYFLQSKLDIGSVNIHDAKLVFHFSALSLFLTINSVPYNGLLISKESMSLFAYIDIVSELLKLSIALCLCLFSSNRIVYYGFLMFIVSLIIRATYAIVCNLKFKDSRYRFVWDKELTAKIFSFTGWTTLSAISYMIRHQGIAIIMNMFLGPIINASIGIGNQVNNAVKAFSQNFQMSFMPQIIKRYASQDYKNMNTIILSGAKLSSYLLIIFSIPIIIESGYILQIWLGEMPANTNVIVSLILIETIVSSMTCTGNTAIRATGNVKLFELCYNVVDLLVLPLMLVLLYILPVYYFPFILLIAISTFSNVVKIIFLSRQIPDFDFRLYSKEILLNIPLITFLSCLIPFIIHTSMEKGIVRLLFVFISFELSFILMVFKFGLCHQELKFLENIICKLKQKWK